MYRAIRGTSDILPAEQPYWRYVEEAIAGITRRYGYERIDTPAFEETGLFTRSVGEGTDIVEKEMYTFDDKGGKSLTLRPEGTASVGRAYVQHGMYNRIQPVRLYYLAPIFRYERPQAGRLREHHQFGCEAIGEADAALDAEVIDLAWQFYKGLGMRDLSLKLNSIGCRECRPVYLEALVSYYSGFKDKLCEDCRVRLVKNPLRLLDCKQTSCQGIADKAPVQTGYLCPACGEHFTRLQGYLKLLNIPYQPDHRMVRGFDYYTRTVFEVMPPGGGSQGSIGGGGRYDDLIAELGGRPTPAVGFAAGIERIILNIKEQGIAVPGLPGLEVLVVHLGEVARETALHLAAELRRAGTGAVTTYGDKSLKAQLRQANSLGVRYAVIIGEDEVRDGTVTLRDMTDARQRTIPVGDVLKVISPENGTGA